MDQEKQISYRFIKSTEQTFLNEMLYEAIFVEEGKPKLPKSIIKDPSISKYIDDFGSKTGDVGIVAVHENIPIGVIWGRFFSEEDPGYGFVDSDTPEIGMAIKPNYRGKGIGTELLNRVEKAYVQLGVKALLLSVDKMNPAKRLYERAEYITYSEIETSVIMVKEIL
jgi:GNAT superfamily N-acetyltransferase